MKPQTEEQWTMVLDVVERLYAEVRAGNWDGLRQMLHGYTTPASVSPEPAAGQVLEYTDPDDGDLVTVCPTCGQAHCGLSRDILRQKLGLSETKSEKQS